MRNVKVSDLDGGFPSISDVFKMVSFGGLIKNWVRF